jgi:hypothetical protein
LKTRTTALLAAITLSGILLSASACASPPNTEPNATPLTVSATPVNPLPSATATTTVTPAPATSETTAAAPTAESRQSAPMETFTLPDGHISFDYFPGWTVTVKPGPVNSADEQKISFEATVKDESGTVLARVYSGKYGDGAAGPAKRTVLDHSPVSGIVDKSGGVAQFGFAYDEALDGNLYYIMDVREAHEFLAPDGSSGSNQIALPDRIMNAYVVLTDSPSTLAFPSPAAAKAWMETGRYAQLKTLLLSVTYK